MPRLTAENIALTFPFYSRVMQTRRELKNDDRIIGRRGQTVGVKALKNVSIDLKTGDRLAIVGRNGAGKTSLLQVLAGLIPPDEGQVIVEGRSTNLININLGLRPQASGHRNITLIGLAAGRTREEIEAVRPDVTRFSELGGFLDMPVESYSSGMRVRLSFAIATAFRPDILILDEWLSTGDASFRKKASERMSSFVSDAGILVLASHNPALLKANCNRAIWMHEGRVHQAGEVDAILQSYSAATG